MFLEYLFTDLTFFVIALNVTSNICSLVIEPPPNPIKYDVSNIYKIQLKHQNGLFANNNATKENTFVAQKHAPGGVLLQARKESRSSP